MFVWQVDGGRGKKPVKIVGDPLVRELAMMMSVKWKNARRVSALETVALPGMLYTKQSPGLIDSYGSYN